MRELTRRALCYLDDKVSGTCKCDRGYRGEACGDNSDGERQILLPF
jgi:hypothetical protein